MPRGSYWLDLAKYDLETAEIMLLSQRYLYVGFMCHQSIEKMLKAIYSERWNKIPPKIHNLARLLRLVDLGDEISPELLDIIHQLNPLNVATRYPDEELDILEDLDEKYAGELLKETRRLFEWLRTRL
jgi:HEPN domain-containing protein